MPLTQVSSRAIEDTLRYVLGADGTSHYTFTGKGLNGAVNDPTIYLVRGQTYIFENRSGGHPFYIKTSIANGGTNDAYNTGVTNNGGGNNTEIVFTVPHDAPDTLYYQCSSHASMAGEFKIAGSVADGSITSSKIATATITAANLGNDCVGTAELQNSAVETINIQDDAVTEDKLANSINSAIAANTAKDLTALSASNLTSGTVPDARFPSALPAIDGSALTGITSVPTGAVFAFAMDAAPSGYLECSGAAVSRSAYSALFAAIGTTYGAGDGSSTFNLPNLRGEFIRGLDNGRGVDSNRAMGSAQGHGIPRLYGRFADHHVARMNAYAYSGFTNPFTEYGTTAYRSDLQVASGSGGVQISFDSDRVIPATADVRPRNVAMLYCIKV